MTTEITRKQAILLSVLGALLVVVLFVQLLIRPLLTRASETKAYLVNLEQQYSDLLLQSESYDQNMEQLEGWKEKNSKETSKLFPLSDPNRLDRFLTFVMNECGVSVSGLSISQTVQYYIDGEGNLITASPDDVSGGSADSSGSTDGSTNGSTDGGASYTATGEYACDFTYTMEGSYQDMTKMLNFVNRVSFLGITAYSFNSVEKQETADQNSGSNTARFQDQYSFTMTITAYMYQSPLETDAEKNTEDTTEEADAAVQQDAA